MNKRFGLAGMAGLATVSVAMLPDIARADAGVPMLAVAWPLSWCAFIPVVLVEALIAMRTLNFTWRASWHASFAANAASTIIGIPMTWLVLAIIDIGLSQGGRAYGLDTIPKMIFAVTVQSAWLIPYEDDLYWMIPAALLVLLPFFGLSSVYIEKLVFRKVSKCSPAQASGWAWRANLLTYGIAMISVVMWLLVSTTMHK